MSEGAKANTVIKNTTMLYIMNIAKLILPLVTLPYLTRVLSKDCYGVVSYVKAVMQYMQIVVDFGFLLSATKDIVKVRDDRKALAETIGDTLLAKLFLVIGAFGILSVLIGLIPILRKNPLFVLLSFGVVALTCLLMDFLFRGLERMQVITIRYVVMRLISTVLTFVFVKADSDMLWIPVLDILGSLAAIALVLREMKKQDIQICFTGVKGALRKLRNPLCISCPVWQRLRLQL